MAPRVDAEARQQSSGDAIKIYNGRGEFGAKAHVTDDVPPGVVWIRDGWVGLNHPTSGDAVLTGDALSLFPSSVGRSDYGRIVEVALSHCFLTYALDPAALLCNLTKRIWRLTH